MRAILLGGNDSANERWIERVEKAIAPTFDAIEIQRSRHWGKEREKVYFDIDHEVSELEKRVAGKDPYAIFAKSAGGWVALKAISEGRVAPEKLIVVGAAMNPAIREGIPIDLWLPKLEVPSLWIQHSGDRAIPFKELDELLDEHGVANREMVELPGNDHEYEEVDLIASFIADSMSKDPAVTATT